MLACQDAVQRAQAAGCVSDDVLHEQARWRSPRIWGPQCHLTRQEQGEDAELASAAGMLSICGAFFLQRKLICPWFRIMSVKRKTDQADHSGLSGPQHIL